MWRLLSLATVLFFAPTIAFAQITKDFLRTGQSETLVTSWSVFGGTTTSQSWSGLIEVIISGFGVNVPSSGLLEDPFYRIDPEAADVPVTGPGVLPPIGLHLSFTGCAAQTECGAPHIYPFMIYVDGVGFIQPLPPEPSLDLILQTIPYSPQHVYRFVIDIGANPEVLTLGHGDGGVFDNSGHFAIQLFGVERTKKGGGGRRDP